LRLAADNLAWDTIGERDPDTGSTLFAHVHLLQRSGIYIMENMNLEALSAAKAYVFAFIGIPLKRAAPPARRFVRSRSSADSPTDSVLRGGRPHTGILHVLVEPVDLLGDDVQQRFARA
jgi:hypothetical protein